MDTSAPSSPAKRTKRHGPNAVAAAVAQVIVSEPALLELVAAFIPQDAEGVGASKSLIVLETIRSLCFAFPTLARPVGPSNEAFWRAMVLSHFDFSTVGVAFNVEDISGVWGDHVPDVFSSAGDSDDDVANVNGDWDDDDEYEFLPVADGMTPREWTESCRAQSAAARRAWGGARGRRGKDNDVFFGENYAWWPAIGAYFRPSQFGFLAKVHVDRSLVSSEWPDHERAFSLFHDLVVLQKLVRERGRFQTYSDGEQPLTPCLLSQLEADPLEERHATLQHCGFLPPYWNSGRPGVSTRWAGLDDPVPTVDLADVRSTRRKRDAPFSRIAQSPSGREEYASKEECAVFPRCSIPEFMGLRRLVYESFDDWRRVHVNRGEYTGPEFYIGRSKRSHRWIGLMGVSDYEGYD